MWFNLTHAGLERTTLLVIHSVYAIVHCCNWDLPLYQLGKWQWTSWNQDLGMKKQIGIKMNKHVNIANVSIFLIGIFDYFSAWNWVQYPPSGNSLSVPPVLFPAAEHLSWWKVQHMFHNTRISL